VVIENSEVPKYFAPLRNNRFEQVASRTARSESVVLGFSTGSIVAVAVRLRRHAAKTV
jgi:cysteine synthase